jgi:lipopolysaccharide transport system permease protein
MTTTMLLGQTPERTGARRVKVIRPTTLGAFSLLGQFADLAQYTDLIYTLSMHRIRVRYKQSVLGVSWAIMQPLSLMLTYTVIFSYITKISSEGLPYPIFAFAGLLPWLYFQTALTSATGGLVSHRDLITKVYFPREILPLTYVIAAAFDFLVSSTVLAAMMLYYGVTVTWYVLYAVPILAIMTVFMVGVSLMLSATQVRIRDVGVAIPLVLQLWMFATPIVYPYSAIAGKIARPLEIAYTLNPLVGVIENFRRVVLQGVAPHFATLGMSLVISMVLLPVAYVYFKHIEGTMADII